MTSSITGYTLPNVVTLQSPSTAIPLRLGLLVRGSVALQLGRALVYIPGLLDVVWRLFLFFSCSSVCNSNLAIWFCIEGLSLCYVSKSLLFFLQLWVSCLELESGHLD